MVRFPLQSLPSFLVVSTFLLALLVGVGNVRGDDAAYDEQEAIRRAAERLNEYDKAQKEAARRRYDDAHSSSSGDSGSGAACCVGIIIFIVVAVMWNVRNTKEQQAQMTREATLKQLNREEQEAQMAKEAKYEQGQKALLAERLAKATSLGFSVDDETKECPACAETIKFKAKICRYCQKEFSDGEIEKATQSKVDAFLSDYKSA